MDFEFLFEKIGFAETGRESFRQIHRRTANPSFRKSFERSLAEYEKGDAEFAAYLDIFAQQEQLPVEILNMYIYIRKCEQALEQFRARGIDDGVFYASAASLSSSCQYLLDRQGMYGISRWPHRPWMRHFFNIEIFRLDRLEFEYMHSKYDAEIDGHILRKGDPCIGVHIPKGTLNAQECEDAYAVAREFFKKYYGMDTCIFFCVSWLLHPWLSEELGADSRIVAFQKNFKILDRHEGSDSLKQMLQWIFKNPNDDPNNFPENTSLQRAAKRRLIEGLPLGEASGIRL